AAAQKAGLNYVVVERGCIANSIARFPVNMTFFSTSERLAIGDIPFITPKPNPTRQEALAYYRQVTDALALKVLTYREVTRVERAGGDGFVVDTVDSRTGRGERRCRTNALVIATGYFDNPNRLQVPGEDLPHVSHYFDDAHPYYGRRVGVRGGLGGGYGGQPARQGGPALPHHRPGHAPRQLRHPQPPPGAGGSPAPRTPLFRRGPSLLRPAGRGGGGRNSAVEAALELHRA